jgi:formate dehydrogenase subunit gamma
MSPERIGRSVVRYSVRERLVHQLAALSYVYVLLTGLAFWTPGLYWMAAALGGGYVSRLLHPWGGVVFSVALARMFVLWRRDMRATEADRRWRRALAHYVRNEDDRVPPAGRFNFGQKQLFWVMTWAGAALFLSGLVLWRPDVVPASLNWLRGAAVLVHAASALVTIGAFIVHLYMGLFVVPGGLKAITHGVVTEEWARRHHSLWLDE